MTRVGCSVGVSITSREEYQSDNYRSMCRHPPCDANSERAEIRATHVKTRKAFLRETKTLCALRQLPSMSDFPEQTHCTSPEVTPSM